MHLLQPEYVDPPSLFFVVAIVVTIRRVFASVCRSNHFIVVSLVKSRLHSISEMSCSIVR